MSKPKNDSIYLVFNLTFKNHCWWFDDKKEANKFRKFLIKTNPTSKISKTIKFCRDY